MLLYIHNYLHIANMGIYLQNLFKWIRKITKQSFKNNPQNAFTWPNNSTLSWFWILKFNNIFDFEVAKLMHQLIHEKAPKNFKSYFICSSNILAYSTRQKSENHLFLPRFHISRTHRSK